MNAQQSLWFQQVLSDYHVLTMLRQNDGDPCQQLHYLQMVTEKLGKAYFWRTGYPPQPTHISFVKFLQALYHRPTLERKAIERQLGFGNSRAFRQWIVSINPLAYELERLAPSLAGDTGPNPEYPWPRQSPEYTPATFQFSLWPLLHDTGRGRELLRFIDTAVRNFAIYA